MVDPIIVLALVALAFAVGALVGIVYERDRNPPSGKSREV